MALIGVVIIISVVAYLLYRNIKKKQRLESEEASAESASEDDD